jgi:hypothetical protein
MRKKLQDVDKKQKLSICISPALMNIINDMNNKSKYIEKLIYNDLLAKNKITKDIEL